ncbi:hypothetical protein PFISCL1PPCAC_6885 [Pristionchus fissidentatus]|uniref:acid phosphatase n=1 Tax=Pristionchus fissidentatus TaxID=1538716 RepID=A0AAV5V8P8_9BILA|nr:hypothetical protein PFISCL1PPCAC_6885 [Pristionchus fissidentatus]
MILLCLLSLSVPVFSLPFSQREANYRALPDDVSDPASNYKLIFANAVWRHGDRSPERPLPGDGTDLFGEEDWKFGGGGYGELSPAGMEQQFIVGSKIGDRYINQFGILSQRYRAKEIYIRSTDYNRTLISAYSNLAGMYYGSGKADVDLPTFDKWPQGWVPVPVHTVVNKYDYTGNPDAECKRKMQVRDLIISSPEFLAYQNDPQVAATLSYLSTNSDSDVTLQNSYYFQDTMTCERLHMSDLNDTQTEADISNWYPWFYQGNVADMTNNIVAKVSDFQDGLGNPNGVQGVDVSVEMPKMRAGETVNTIYGMIQGAINCYNDMDSTDCKPFYKKLRYFALSAHDKTLNAFLTLLGPKKYVIPMGYPTYAATVLIELYVNEDTREQYFKVLYLAGPDDNFKSITNYVRGCPMTKEFCPLSALKDIVDVYMPKPDMATYCDIDVFAPTQAQN